MRYSTIFATLLAVVSAATIPSKRTTVTLTLNDYPSFADGRADNNPPTCGMSYKDLNLDRITALGGLVAGSDCGKCAHVCGSAGCEYFLVVDLCTLEAGHLDISTGGGMGVVGCDTGVYQVSVEYVDQSNCAGIWNGDMFWSWDKPTGELAKLASIQAGEGSTYQATSAVAAEATSTPCTTSTVTAYTPPTSTKKPVYHAPSTTEIPVYTPPSTSEAPAYTPTPSSTEAAYTPAPSTYEAPVVSSAPVVYSTQAAVVSSTPAVYSTPSYATPSSEAGVYSSAAAVPYSSAAPVYAPEKSAAVSYAASMAAYSYATGVPSVTVVASGYSTGFVPKPTGTGYVTYSSPSPSVVPFTGAASSVQFNVVAALGAAAAALLIL